MGTLMNRCKTCKWWEKYEKQRSATDIWGACRMGDDFFHDLVSFCEPHDDPDNIATRPDFGCVLWQEQDAQSN